MSECEDQRYHADRDHRAVSVFDRNLHVPTKGRLLHDARHDGAHEENGDDRPHGVAAESRPLGELALRNPNHQPADGRQAQQG